MRRPVGGAREGRRAARVLCRQSVSGNSRGCLNSASVREEILQRVEAPLMRAGDGGDHQLLHRLARLLQLGIVGDQRDSGPRTASAAARAACSRLKSLALATASSAVSHIASTRRRSSSDSDLQSGRAELAGRLFVGFGFPWDRCRGRGPSPCSGADGVVAAIDGSDQPDVRTAAFLDRVFRLERRRRRHLRRCRRPRMGRPAGLAPCSSSTSA